MAERVDVEDPRLLYLMRITELITDIEKNVKQIKHYANLFSKKFFAPILLSAEGLLKLANEAADELIEPDYKRLNTLEYIIDATQRIQYNHMVFLADKFLKEGNGFRTTTIMRIYEAWVATIHCKLEGSSCYRNVFPTQIPAHHKFLSIFRMKRVQIIGREDFFGMKVAEESRRNDADDSHLINSYVKIEDAFDNFKKFEKILSEKNVFTFKEFLNLEHPDY